MKRLILLWVLLLLLCGCSVQEEPVSTTAPKDLEVPPSPAVSPLLDESSPLFQQTGGAVTTYRVDDKAFTALLPMGSGLLAMEEADFTNLYLLSGGPMEVTATATLDGAYSAKDLLQASDRGLALYRAEHRSILFLDSTLKEIRTLQLPANAIGDAAVSPDLNTVYYCTDAGIYAIDLLTGISRLLQQNNAASAQSITGLLFDGKMLRHQITLADGSTQTHLVSAETGQILYAGDRANDLFTGGEHYFLAVDSEILTQLVFGSTDGTPGALWPAEPIKNCIPVPERNALIALYPTGNACRLAYYDLTSGKHTADLTLPDIPGIYSLFAGTDGRIWFCTYDEATHSTGIQCWDTTLSPAGDDAVYTGKYYSRENPDTEGFAALDNRLAELETTVGVDIILGEAAAQVQPWANSFVTEFLVPMYDAWLPQLETALGKFPAGFLADTVSDGLHIVVVRSIQGLPENNYTDEVGGFQYWFDGGTYIALSMDEDPAPALYHTLSYLIDTRVMAQTTSYKSWHRYNPENFSYDNSYTANKNRDDWQYLQDDNRYFIDMFSMSFAIEDRAQIFEYAMIDGNEAYFQSRTMQRKLKAVCDGIRKAYGLTEDERVFPWEQYLPR